MSLLSTTLVLFLVMDPLGNLPLFVSALSDVRPERRTRIVLRESAIALGILVVFLVSGKILMATLGLSEAALRIAGGAILFLIAVHMIFPREGGLFGADLAGEPLIVPLAVPLVAGPSSLCLVLVMSADESLEGGVGIAALCLAWLASTAILLLAQPVRRLLGRRGLVALERLMGLVLGVLAVQMILDALVQLGVLSPWLHARGVMN